MQYQIVGILLIFISLILGYLSLQAYRKNNFRKAVLWLVVIGLSLRLFIASDRYLHKWDESYHALVAKNMISDPFAPKLYKEALIEYDYRNWTKNHIWLHKQPFPLWTMGASLTIFSHSAFAVRLPSILLGTLGIWIIFLLGARLFNQKAGAIAAFFMATNGLILELTSGRSPTDHIDVFFLSFVLFAILTVVEFQKTKKIKYLFFTGLLTGISVLCKWLPGLVVIPVWMVLTHGGLPFNKWLASLAFLILITLAIFLPWQIYTYIEFPTEFIWEQEFNSRHITEALIYPENGYFYHWRKIWMLYGAMVYIPLAYYVYRMISNKISRAGLAVLVWFLLPYVFFTFVQTRMQGYTLFAAPALFLMIGVFISEELERHWKTFNAVRYLLISLLLILPLIHTFERLKPFHSRDINPGWIKQIKSLPQEIHEDRVAIFNAQHYVNIMFYTPFLAYEDVPSKEEVEKLQQKGYTVYVNTSPAIPVGILEMKEVRTLKLIQDN
ncbi:MAG: glycosyltransferase family 39 protein [Bacteroidetes bacterium]|nr:glycosyltransferase family 39 protein [Bacteroidota bacterium]